MTLYLAHPFDSRHKIRAWELSFEFRTGIELINPFYDTDRKDIEKIDRGEASKFDFDPFTIVTGDLELVYNADGLVAIVEGQKQIGTIMEIVYANYYKKPVYLVVTNGQERSPWLIYHATRIFTTLGDFEYFIREEL